MTALQLCREYRGLRLPYRAPHYAAGVLRELQADGYEMLEILAVHEALRSGDRVLELGGGMGIVSGYMARDPRSVHVDVVEANPALVPAIRALHADNGLAHKTTVHFGAAGLDDEPRRFVAGENLLSGATQAEGAGQTVPGLALPDLLRSTGATLLVMDIEGAELDIISNLPDFDQVKRLVLEVHPALYGVAGITAIITEAARHGFHYDVQGSRQAVLLLRRD